MTHPGGEGGGRRASLRGWGGPPLASCDWSPGSPLEPRAVELLSPQVLPGWGPGPQGAGQDQEDAGLSGGTLWFGHEKTPLRTRGWAWGPCGGLGALGWGTAAAWVSCSRANPLFTPSACGSLKSAAQGAGRCHVCRGPGQRPCHSSFQTPATPHFLSCSKRRFTHSRLPPLACPSRSHPGTPEVHALTALSLTLE